jgi:serine/threonine-protein kinase RsbW
VSIQIVMMLPPRAASVSLARHTLGEALSVPGVAPDCIHEAQLALSEACSNVLRHLTADQNFEVLINVGEVELTMHILDGEDQSLRDRKLANWPDTDVEHDGGMTLMTAFADHASFESDDAGGGVRLKKRLRWNPETSAPTSGVAPATG